MKEEVEQTDAPHFGEGRLQSVFAMDGRVNITWQKLGQMLKQDFREMIQIFGRKSCILSLMKHSDAVS